MDTLYFNIYNELDCRSVRRAAASLVAPYADDVLDKELWNAR